MMEETGKITAIEGHYAYVMALPSSACDGCSQKGTCHVMGGSGEMIIKAVNQAGGMVGDMVLVTITSRTFYKVSSLIYLFPVAALIVGALFGKAVATHLSPNLSGELISAIFGLASLGISFFIVKLLSSKIGESETDKARVIRVLNA